MRDSYERLIIGNKKFAMEKKFDDPEYFKKLSLASRLLFLSFSTADVCSWFCCNHWSCWFCALTGDALATLRAVLFRLVAGAAAVGKGLVLLKLLSKI